MPKHYKSKLTKQNAVQKLTEFMARVEHWNSHYAHYFQFKDIVLVGSLARGEDKVGDIDICYKVERTNGSSFVEHLNEYCDWRKEELGYAYPRDYFEMLCVPETDPVRFAKNRYGRYETLGWNQFDLIVLNLEPFVYLMKDAERTKGSILSLIEAAEPLSMEEALSLVAERSAKTLVESDVSDYCEFISLYPKEIREAIIKRDSITEDYASFVNTTDIK